MGEYLTHTKIFRIENMYNIYLIIEKSCPMAPGAEIWPEGPKQKNTKIYNQKQLEWRSTMRRWIGLCWRLIVF